MKAARQCPKCDSLKVGYLEMVPEIVGNNTVNTAAPVPA